MRHFRVELDTIETASFIRNHCHRAAWCLSSNLEAFRKTGNLVTMTHPDMQLVFTVLQVPNQLVTYQDIHFCITEFMDGARLNFTAQLFTHGLQAITDPQYRYT